MRAVHKCEAPARDNPYPAPQQVQHCQTLNKKATASSTAATRPTCSVSSLSVSSRGTGAVGVGLLANVQTDARRLSPSPALVLAPAVVPSSMRREVRRKVLPPLTPPAAGPGCAVCELELLAAAPSLPAGASLQRATRATTLRCQWGRKQVHEI